MTGAIRVMPWPDPGARRARPRSPLLVRRDVLAADARADRAPAACATSPTASSAHPKGVDLPVADTAAALGLGPREGQQSPLMRSLTRLQQFELACTDDETTIAVRTTLPPVHRRHVRRLPAALQAAARGVDRRPGAAPVELARRRARRVALTLVAQGEPIDTVERALHARGFHPALAHEAVRWARDRQHELDDDTADVTDTPTRIAPAAAPLDPAA